MQSETINYISVIYVIGFVLSYFAWLWAIITERSPLVEGDSDTHASYFNRNNGGDYFIVFIFTCPFRSLWWPFYILILLIVGIGKGLVILFGDNKIENFDRFKPKFKEKS